MPSKVPSPFSVRMAVVRLPSSLNPREAIAHGPARRSLAFTEDELEELAAEFAEYAAHDIADLLAIDAAPAVLQEIANEVAHAIRCTLDELPQARPSPGLTLRSAAAETLTTPSVLRVVRHSSGE
jgi:hypothetical protein